MGEPLHSLKVFSNEEDTVVPVKKIIIQFNDTAAEGHTLEYTIVSYRFFAKPSDSKMYPGADGTKCHECRWFLPCRMRRIYTSFCYGCNAAYLHVDGEGVVPNGTSEWLGRSLRSLVLNTTRPCVTVSKESPCVPLTFADRSDKTVLAWHECHECAHSKITKTFLRKASIALTEILKEENMGWTALRELIRTELIPSRGNGVFMLGSIDIY